MQSFQSSPDVARLRGVRGRAVAHVVEAAAEKRGGSLTELEYSLRQASDITESESHFSTDIQV